MDKKSNNLKFSKKKRTSSIEKAVKIIAIVMVLIMLGSIILSLYISLNAL